MKQNRKKGMHTLNSFQYDYLFIYLFRPHHVACRIFVPRPGIKPITPAVEAQSLNHWTAREVLQYDFLGESKLKGNSDPETMPICPHQSIKAGTEKRKSPDITSCSYSLFLTYPIFSRTPPATCP